MVVDEFESSFRKEEESSKLEYIMSCTLECHTYGVRVSNHEKKLNYQITRPCMCSEIF